MSVSSAISGIPIVDIDGCWELLWDADAERERAVSEPREMRRRGVRGSIAMTLSVGVVDDGEREDVRNRVRNTV